MADAIFHSPISSNPRASFSSPTTDEPTFIAEIRVTNHDKLKGRDLPNQHPISAITGLIDELNELNEKTQTYIHEQGVASAVWTVQHNLNKYPSVIVVDSSENVVIPDVKYIDENNIQITMTGASKGRAYLN